MPQTQKQTSKQSRRIVVTKKAAIPTSLWFYVDTPSSMKLLRAYFIAVIQLQNAWREGAPFRLWRGGNFSKHVEGARLTKANGIYTLTGPGFRFFSSPEQYGDKELVERMKEAVRTGKGCKDYASPTTKKPYEMIEQNITL